MNIVVKLFNFIEIFTRKSQIFVRMGMEENGKMKIILRKATLNTVEYFRKNGKTY